MTSDLSKNDAFLAGLHRRMRLLREAKNINQTQMAKMMDVSREVWSKYENRSPLPINLIFPFCRVVGCDVEYLLLGKRNRPRVVAGNEARLTEFKPRQSAIG